MFIISLGDAGLKKEIGLFRAFNILIYVYVCHDSPRGE